MPSPKHERVRHGLIKLGRKLQFDVVEREAALTGKPQAFVDVTWDDPASGSHLVFLEVETGTDRPIHNVMKIVNDIRPRGEWPCCLLIVYMGKPSPLHIARWIKAGHLGCTYPLPFVRTVEVNFNGSPASLEEDLEDKIRKAFMQPWAGPARVSPAAVFQQFEPILETRAANSALLLAEREARVMLALARESPACREAAYSFLAGVAEMAQKQGMMQSCRGLIEQAEGIGKSLGKIPQEWANRLILVKAKLNWQRNLEKTPNQLLEYLQETARGPRKAFFPLFWRIGMLRGLLDSRVPLESVKGPYLEAFQPDGPTLHVDALGNAEFCTGLVSLARGDYETAGNALRSSCVKYVSAAILQGPCAGLTPIRSILRCSYALAQCLDGKYRRSSGSLRKSPFFCESLVNLGSSASSEGVQEIHVAALRSGISVTQGWPTHVAREESLSETFAHGSPLLPEIIQQTNGILNNLGLEEIRVR